MTQREITFICTDSDISPRTLQYGGLQGEDNATELTFDISDLDLTVESGHSVAYRMDCTDGTGGFYSESLTLQTGNSNKKYVVFSVPYTVTRPGGVAKLHLVISELDADNVETEILYSKTAKLYFDATGDGSVSRNQYKRELSGLVEEASNAAEIAQEAANKLSQHNSDPEAHYRAFSDHNNDSGAHQPLKDYSDGKLIAHNTNGEAHADIRDELARKENSGNRIVSANATGADATDGQYYSAAATEKRLSAEIETHDEDTSSHVDIRSRVEAVNAAIGTTVSSHNNSETAHADIRGELAGKENVSNRVVQANATGADVTDGQYYSAAATEKRLSAKIEAHNSSNENVHPYILQSIPAQINAHNNSETAHEDIRAALENISSVTQYGVRFEGAANSGDTVTRLYDAQGLVAGVGTDTQTAVNDFDHIYPWGARRRCCGTFDETGNFVVNAYEGEAGYATDGTGGEVWVEHSLFYYKHIYDGDAEEILISAFPIGGFLPAPIFVLPDGTVSQKAYTAAYPMATVDGKATSRSGVFSDICSLNSAMTTARTLGKNYTATTTAEWYTDCLYMWVEFATRDLQSVMAGASSLPYDNTNTATVAETNVNRMIVANAVADAFVVGQTIGIGTSLGGTQIASNRVVTAIDVYDADNKAISFDGSPVNIAVGNIVWSSVYINGTCDHVLSSSGSPVSNTSGKYNCIYRGKETPYGNAFEWISDILLKREGGGTIEDPYIYDIYYLPDPAKYANGVITDDYIKLNYQLPADDGYIKKLGFDSRYPHLRLPAQLGGSSSAYYTDYYYPPANDICAAHVGGFVSYGKNDGPCYWYCHYQPTLISNSRRARLSYRRGNRSGSSTLDSLGVTATAAELNYCDGLTGNIQNQIDALADGDPTTPIDGGTF